MKGIAKFILTAGMGLAMVMPLSAADSGVSVRLDGELVDFSGQQPVIVEGRTLIPLRGVFEQMGYSIEWVAETKTAVLSSQATTVSVTAGSNQMKVNDRVETIDVPAQIMNGSMMIPLRAIGESAGANVSWNGAEKMVDISTEAASPEDIARISDYFAAYGKAVEPLNEVAELAGELQSLEGDITPEQIGAYRERLTGAKTVTTAVRSQVEALTVPDIAADLHRVRLQAIDSFDKLVDLLLNYCDGKVTEAKMDEELNAISQEVTEVTKENDRLLRELESAMAG